MNVIVYKFFLYIVPVSPLLLLFVSLIVVLDDFLFTYAACSHKNNCLHNVLLSVIMRHTFSKKLSKRNANLSVKLCHTACNMRDPWCLHRHTILVLHAVEPLIQNKCYIWRGANVSLLLFIIHNGTRKQCMHIQTESATSGTFVCSALSLVVLRRV